MNAKTDRWESYLDKAGRRHWRWPAANEPIAARLVDDRERRDGAPRWQYAETPRELSQGD